MNAWQKNKKKEEKNKVQVKNNRINIIMAIVFILGLATVYKLFDLQVKNYDLYSALALSQHQISSQLQPERGSIYITDYDSNGETELYPFATNKDFAFVFIVPEDIEINRQDEFAENLYTIFKKEEVEEEVEELLQTEEETSKEEELNYIADWPEEERIAKETEILNRYNTLASNAEYQALRNDRKEEEIEDRKDTIIEEYMEKIEKEGDPYEPIEQKVDDEKLKDLYVLFASNEGTVIDPSDLRIKGESIIFDDTEEELSITGLGFNMINHRYYPEDEVGSHILGFVRVVDDTSEGAYGLEGFFNEELTGQYGYVKSERSADKNVIILNDREYVEPVNGKDYILTINRSVQYTVCQKFKASAESHQVDGGSVIVMDPFTGAIIAMCSYPDFDPNNYKDVEDIEVYNNPAIFDQYEPGSVFKTITMAASIDQEKITPETTYNDEGYLMIDGWNNPIKNSDYDTAGGHGEVNMNYVLEYSLNTGAIYAMRQIGNDTFIKYVKNFGFGEKTGIEMETESAGNIVNLQGDNVHEIYTATASFGQGISVTPLQMIASYGAIANGGILMKPYLVKEVINEDGTRETIEPIQIRRVISERAATLTSGMLVNVVDGGHAKLAGVSGYYVGGKTGTAQVASAEVRGYGSATIHTFIGMAPIEDPAFVMLVKLDDPKDVAYSASSAAPLFGEIAEFLLNYYEIPKERDDN